MDNSILRKYVMKEEQGQDFLHSSAYAKNQSGESIGAAGAGTESFQRRQEMDRKFVGGYGDSKIGSAMSMSMPRPKVYSGESGARGGMKRPLPPTAPTR